VGRLPPADYATIAGGFIAALSVPAAVAGYYDLAVRLLFASYALDVLDGWLARKYGSREDGFFLDRAYDRLAQVVGPGVLLLSWASTRVPQEWYLAYSIYFAGFAAMAYYRLVRRGVRSLQYFNGLPLFAHAILIIASVIAGSPPHPLILLALLAASSLPIPYFRRRKGGSTPSPALAPRLLGLTLLALLPYDNPVVVVAARIVIVLILAYAVIGPIAARLALERPGH